MTETWAVYLVEYYPVGEDVLAHDCVVAPNEASVKRYIELTERERWALEPDEKVVEEWVDIFRMKFMVGVDGNMHRVDTTATGKPSIFVPDTIREGMAIVHEQA